MIFNLPLFPKTKYSSAFFMSSLIFYFCCISCAEAENSWKLSSEFINLGTIFITAKRSDSEEEHTAENVMVYTREDIERSSANNLGEAVKYMPGVDISVTNQFGQATALTIHGSASRQVLVMIDGIPFNTQISGQADPTIIPVEHIERIEVIKGASSSAWGSSLGGVINVITKDTGNSAIPTGQFKSTFAEFGTTKNSLELAGKISELGYFVSGSYLETNGTRARSDVQENKIFGKLSYPLTDNTKITGSFGYTGAHVHDGIFSDDTWVSMPYIARYGKINLENQQDDFNINIAYKYNDQDILSDTYVASTGDLDSSNLYYNTYQGVSITGSLHLRDKDVWAFGSDFDWHEFKSNNFLDNSKRISMQTPYMNYTYKWHNWDFIPGLRYDHNQQFGSQTSPSLGMIYHFEDARQSLARFRVSRAFNAPPLMWIYSDDASQWVGPNPDLKAERATMYEAGFETKPFASVKIKLDLYRADVKDALALVWDAGVYKYDNFKKFRRQGAELSLHYQVNDDLTLRASGAFTDVENRETRKLVRDADIARQSFSLGANYKNEKGSGFHLYGSYRRWSADPGEANDRKFILDAKLTQEFKDVKGNIDLEIFLNIYNLTNSKYWSNPDYPLPRRYFEGGFSLKF